MEVEMKTEAVAVLLVKMGKVRVASPNCPIVPSPDTLTNGAATDKKKQGRDNCVFELLRENKPDANLSLFPSPRSPSLSEEPSLPLPRPSLPTSQPKTTFYYNFYMSNLSPNVQSVELSSRPLEDLLQNMSRSGIIVIE
jgi:hypothetical protein